MLNPFVFFDKDVTGSSGIEPSRHRRSWHCVVAKEYAAWPLASDHQIGVVLRKLVEGLVSHSVGVESLWGIGVESEFDPAVGSFHPIENDVLGDRVTSHPLDYVCSPHRLRVDRRPIIHLAYTQFCTDESAILNVHCHRIPV